MDGHQVPDVPFPTFSVVSLPGPWRWTRTLPSPSAGATVSGYPRLHGVDCPLENPNFPLKKKKTIE